jgi:hypothetical protein
MSFDDDVVSEEDNRPRDGLQIDMNNVTHRVSTNNVDTVIDGFTYKAASAKREDLVIVQSADEAALKFTMPLAHPAMQRYMQQCLPPRDVVVTLWTMQKRSGQVRQAWKGYWTSLSMDDVAGLGTMLVPDELSAQLDKRIATITTNHACFHQLFDPGCRLNAADFAFPVTVAHVDGATVEVGSIGVNPDNWFTEGLFVHSSGEHQKITGQIGVTLSLEFPIYDGRGVPMKVGDTGTIYPGCSHNVETGCLDKFNNVPNFGGAPFLFAQTTAVFKPFLANGRGVWSNP